jgi:hypothetical protein
VSAPTLWEEGRWSGRRVTRFAVLVSTLLVAGDVALTGRLERLFDSGFIVLCVGIALAVRPDHFFRVGVLPPMLLLGISVLLALVDRAAVAHRTDAFVQAVVSGLAHHAGPLTAGYALTLAVLGIRTRVARRRLRAPVRLPVAASHSNRDASPAPYRTISASPEVRSTTVVDSEPASPSMTASTS